jgi:nicotinamidase/pyrazinamidase
VSGLAHRATALLIVDVQRDFLPGGALGVGSGDEVLEPLVELASRVDVVAASRDWHPADHCSFGEQGGNWPPHCVAGTAGAELHPAIAALPPDLVVDKGTDGGREAYSAFDAPGLARALRERGVQRLLIGGLATDYCVRASALDALEAGFGVTVLEDAVRAVDVAPGDGARALDEIRAAGGRVAASSHVLVDA